MADAATWPAVEGGYAAFLRKLVVHFGVSACSPKAVLIAKRDGEHDITL